MATTIYDGTANSSLTALQFSNQRRLVRLSDGTLIATWHYSTSGQIEFRYSTDGGSTWNTVTHSGSGLESGFSNTADFDIFVDWNDRIHLASYSASGTAGMYYKNGTFSAGTFTWNAQDNFDPGNDSDNSKPSIIAHRSTTDSTKTEVAIAYSASVLNIPRVWLYEAAINNTDGSRVTEDYTAIYSSSGGAAHTYPVIDFHHTGDGKTASSETKFVAFVNGVTNDVLLLKGETRSWNTANVRTLDSAMNTTYINQMSACFDGNRMMVAYTDADGTVNVLERNLADTATTSRTPNSSASLGTIQGISCTHDGSGNLYVVVSGSTNDDVEYAKYTRGSNSWGAWTQVVATTTSSTGNAVSVMRGYDTKIRALFNASDEDIVYTDITTINVAPTAATWVNTDNTASDVAATLVLDWTFNDPDPGDTQSAYALRRQIGAGAYEYWNAGTTSWGGTETKNTSATTQVSLSASWGADGDANHKYAVKTWDASDTEGVYSAELTVIPSAKDNPSLTSPAAAATVTEASINATWTVATQTAYRLRLLSATDVELWSSGWVTSTATTVAVGYTLSNSTTYKVEVTTRNDEGLVSNSDTHTFSTSFTQIDTPTVTVWLFTDSGVTAGFEVDVDNSVGATPVTSFASGALYRRKVGESGDGIRVAADLSLDAQNVRDWSVGSGQDYEYRALAVGANGTTAFSAWVSTVGVT